MNALHRLTYRLRARTRTLERRQRRALTRITERAMIGRLMATRTRQPVPAFLRRAP